MVKERSMLGTENWRAHSVESSSPAAWCTVLPLALTRKYCGENSTERSIPSSRAKWMEYRLGPGPATHAASYAALRVRSLGRMAHTESLHAQCSNGLGALGQAL
eukprot:1142152-Pelagomonas_calceolata.AAC.3